MSDPGDWITPSPTQQAKQPAATSDPGDWITPGQGAAQQATSASSQKTGGMWRNLAVGAEKLPGDLVSSVGDVLRLNQADQIAGPRPAGVKDDESIPNALNRTGQAMTRGIGNATGISPENTSQDNFWDMAARNAGEAAPGLLLPGEQELTLGNMAKTGATFLGSTLGQTAGQEMAPNNPYVQTATALAGGLATGKLASGHIPRPTEDAAALMKEGVPLTPGQMFGPTAKSIEDRISSIPLLGDIVKGGQRAATEAWNKVRINAALSKVGASLPKSMPAGREAIDYAGSTLGDKYDELLPKMTGVADQQLASDFNDIGQKLIGEGATQATLDRLNNVLHAQVTSRGVTPPGPGVVAQSQPPPLIFTGQALKDAQGELGRIGRLHSASADASDRMLGHGLMDAQNAFNAMLERYNPEHSAELKNINNAYAQYVRLNKASGSLGSKDGVFSAPQLASTVKAGDTSARKMNFGRGKAFMQDVSDPANRVLPSTVPDSGTPSRLMGAGLLMSPGAVLHPMAVPGAAAAAMYTRPGMAALGSYGRMANAIPKTPFARTGLIPAGVAAMGQDQSNYRKGGLVP